MTKKQAIHFATPPKQPVGCGTKASWIAFESRLGIELPDDYKAIVDEFGAGVWGNLIILLSPFSDLTSHNMEYQLCGICEWGAQDHRSDEDRYPYDYYPSNPGLLPWATDSNGNRYYWYVNGQPQKWKIVVDLHGNGQHIVDHSVASFLSAMRDNKLGAPFKEICSALRKLGGRDLVYEPISPSFTTPLAYLSRRSKSN